MSEIILASGSPRRRELLKFITEDFEVCPVDADETIPEHIDTAHATIFLAIMKASACAEKNPDKIVIGCDTTVILDGEIMGKPKNREHAFQMLRKLSGRKHFVSTGVSLQYGTNLVHNLTCVTQVEFYELSDEEINAYLDTGEPFDKAGAYGIQGKGSLLVKGIEGDYFNVVGLPVATLSRELKNFQLKIRNRNHL